MGSSLAAQSHGSYILLIKLPEAQTINIGSLSGIHFPHGYFAYVGSALCGIKHRLNRHLKSNKRLHWHIDYLLPKATITDIIIGETEDRIECAIAQALSSQFNSIPGFGASDCRCRSHLFLTSEKRQMKSAVVTILESLEILPKLIRVRGHQIF